MLLLLLLDQVGRLVQDLGGVDRADDAGRVNIWRRHPRLILVLDIWMALHLRLVVFRRLRDGHARLILVESLLVAAVERVVINARRLLIGRK